jgi:hypothetical protein
MTPPFKMKGYTYPGTSPIREDVKESHIPKKTVKEQLLPVTPDDPIAKAPPASLQTNKNEVKKKGLSDQEKADRKDFWRDIAGEAGKAILIAGIQTGAAALSRGNNKSSKKSADISGFSGINFGRK